MSDTLEPFVTPGTLFQGRYEILELIGEGGFSRVYRARQQATGREVAIKLLRSRLAANPRSLARFQRELQLCAQLYHPHIVRLLDSGEAEEAQLFLVFEFIPGRTLAQILAEEGALQPREALHLMMQVLDALGCAHAHGIIHRDLKPQNIMVTSTGVRRNALVLDFGMGTLVTEGAQAEELQARLTSSQDMIGTPAYAAPEQLRGEPASPRADLYTWGLIFLECLTGRQVIHGADLQQVLLEQLGSHPIAIPEALEGQRLGQLLRRTMAREVGERNVTARSLLRELEESSLDWGTLASLSAASHSTPLPAQASPSPVSMLEGERRQITALCYSLRLTGAAISPAVSEELLWEQHEQCTRVARRFGAQVVSLLGEQTLLCFGTPLAREDDARRAAQAALALAAEVGQRGAELESSRGLRLEIRLGLHTGLTTRRAPARLLRAELLAGQGLTPERAVHLAAQAPPGQVLISEDSRRLLRGYFRLEPQGGVYRLVGPYPSSTLGLWQPPQPLPPLIGRQRELDLVLQRWAQACQGHGQSILLLGEPGAGKTLFTQQVTQRVLGTPHLLLAARCSPAPPYSPLRPFAEFLWRLLGYDPAEALEPAPEALEALLSRFGLEPARALPPLAHLLSLHSASPELAAESLLQEHKDPLLDTLLDLLFALCEQQPVLLMVGDLHHAEPTTLELLSLLVNEVPTARLCALFTARPEFTPPWPGSRVLQIQLGPLERPQVEELARSLSPRLAAELLEQVVQRADGVPLFVQELTWLLSEHVGTEPPGVPGTLRDLLMSRLDRLGRARDTARLASVLGRSFSSEELRALSPLEESELQQDLTTLVDADILLRRRTPSGPRYTFKYALLRDVAYESLLEPARLLARARQDSKAAPGEPITQAAQWISAQTPRNTPSGGGPYVV